MLQSAGLGQGTSGSKFDTVALEPDLVFLEIPKPV